MARSKKQKSTEDLIESIRDKTAEIDSLLDELEDKVYDDSSVEEESDWEDDE